MVNIPNSFTIARICLVPVYVLCFYYLPRGWTALAFLAIMLTDMFDGMLARKLNQVTELGKVLDPLADKIMICTALILLVPEAPAIVVSLIVVRELLVGGVRARKNFGANSYGKTKLVLQVVAVMAYLINFQYAQILLILALIASWVSVFTYLKYFKL